MRTTITITAAMTRSTPTMGMATEFSTWVKVGGPGLHVADSCLLESIVMFTVGEFDDKDPIQPSNWWLSTAVGVMLAVASSSALYQPDPLAVPYVEFTCR